MKNVYFMTIWNNSRPFGIVCGHFGIFFPLWYVWTEKNLATLGMVSAGLLFTEPLYLNFASI
jgi:hypothetical protein